jgi:resuscitation-promoting factor RpfA
MGRHSSKRRPRRGLFALGAVAGAVAGLSTSQGTANAAEKSGVVDWTPLINCESGGRLRVTNPDSSASGLFQIIDSTWSSNGGREFAKRAKDATEEQQFIIANRLFERRGLQPWDASKHCWKGRVKVQPGSVKQTGLHRKPDDVPKAEPKRQDPPAEKPGGKHRRTDHIVKVGDTLSDIAAANDCTWQEIFEANRHVVKNPNLINPGLRLTIPV